MTNNKTNFASGENITKKGHYFLGIDREGEKVFMPKPSWSCGWYWSFGWVDTKHSHTLFNCLSDNKNINMHTAFNERFESTPITDSQLWELCDYMRSFYVLQDFAECVGRGNSHYSKTAYNYKDTELAKRINEVELPKLFEAIDELLTN